MQDTKLPERVKSFVGRIFGAAEAEQVENGRPLARPRVPAGNRSAPVGQRSREDFLRRLTDVLQQHKAAARGRRRCFISGILSVFWHRLCAPRGMCLDNGQRFPLIKVKKRA